MNIAIMGFRGIPANYGGYETFIEEMAPRLVERGHHVTVYGRSNIIAYKERYYRGVELIILPTISHKYFDTIIHTLFSILHSLFRSYDVVLVLNAANSPLIALLRLAGKKVALNVDGIERLRKKWNVIGKLYYRIGEYCATKFPQQIVSDADVIRQYYLKTYKAPSVMIPYGSNIEKAGTSEVLEKWGLRPGEYVLYVSRLEPENNADIVIKAFMNVKTDKKLVIVGDAPYSTKYIEYIKKMAAGDDRVIFTGYIFGKGYKELQSHAFCYVQATEVGGTHPALIEAMGIGNCVIANGSDENIEVVSQGGIIYKKNDHEDLRDKIQSVIDNPSLIKDYNVNARRIIRQKYSWDAVTESYESLFKKMI